MFVYNYPDCKIEDKIVVFAEDTIYICKWTGKKWNCIGETRPFEILENDYRISEGLVHWCYYSEFQNFINRQQIFNIKNEL